MQGNLIAYKKGFLMIRIINGGVGSVSKGTIEQRERPAAFIAFRKESYDDDPKNPKPSTINLLTQITAAMRLTWFLIYSAVLRCRAPIAFSCYRASSICYFYNA